MHLPRAERLSIISDFLHSKFSPSAVYLSVCLSIWTDVCAHVSLLPPLSPSPDVCHVEEPVLLTLAKGKMLELELTKVSVHSTLLLFIAIRKIKIKNSNYSNYFSVISVAFKSSEEFKLTNI